MKQIVKSITIAMIRGPGRAIEPTPDSGRPSRSPGQRPAGDTAVDDTRKAYVGARNIPETIPSLGGNCLRLVSVEAVLSAATQRCLEFQPSCRIPNSVIPLK